MLKNNFAKSLSLAILCVLLSACAEQNYRGVAEPTWSKLSPEQKQLIVDESYEKAIEDSSASK